MATANVGTSLFEGNDGNTIVNTAGNKDWLSAPNVNVVIQTDQATGQCDNSFTQGSKEDETNVVIGLGSIPNSKADLGKFGVASETLANGHVMMYLAWTRNNLSGTTNFDFEINQTAQPNMVIQCPGVDRAITLNRIGDAAANGGPGGSLVDDILINYDIQGGAQNPTLGFRRWTGTAWSASTALNATNSEGRISSSPQLFDGVTYPAAAFGEAAIDMTAAGIIPNQNDPNAPCTAFGSAYVKSRASSSFTAQMKDYIAPAGIGLDTCGSITIDKVTLPSGDTQQFTFTPSSNLGGGAQFQLADATAPKVYGSLSPGNFSVAETVPAGWDLTGATCSDGSPVTAISLQASEDITCTFTNTKRGRVIIDKVTQPNPDPTGTVFDFDSNVADGNNDGVADFTLTNAQAPNDSGLIVPGTYRVDELAEAGWTPTGATCTSTEAGDQSTAGAIDVDPGETVTCTFGNNGFGKIVVNKVTNPAGSLQSFEFDTSYGANFFLTDGQSNDSGPLAPGGGYSVDELTPAGWDETSAVCSGGDNPGSITISPGETVTCTFTNTQRGHIIVIKETDPAGSSQAFPFDENWSDGNQDGLADFSLTDHDPNTGSPTHDSGALVPGIYAVDELTPAGWEQKPTVAVCSDSSDPGSISLEPGETVTCIFTNEQDARIFVTKVTDPSGDPQLFDFTANYGPGTFQLSDGGINNSGPLDPGTYSVSEQTPAGWDLTSAACKNEGDVAEDPAAIGLTAGEIVTCTFVNQKDANIIVEKDIVGPNPDDVTFGFTASYSPTGFGLKDGEHNDSGDLSPGSYAAAEVLAPQWKLLNADPNGEGNSVICNNGDNSLSINLDAGRTVTCTFVNERQVGALKIVKVAKDASDAYDPETNPDGDSLSPVPGVIFDVTDANGIVNTFQTGADGTVCVNYWGFQTLTVHERVPDGYDEDSVPDQQVVIDTVSYCDPEEYGAAPVEAQFENIPLTDVTILVNSQIEGATNSRIVCTDVDGNMLDTITAGDGSLFFPDLKPTDPLVATLRCEVFIDP